MTENKMTRDQLKVLALRERIATIVVEYEDKDADRRIVITEQEQRINELLAQVEELQNMVPPVEDAVEDVEEA